jgi:hypothetical protein
MHPRMYVLTATLYCGLLPFGSVAVAEDRVATEDLAVIAHATVHGHEIPVYRIAELQAPATSRGMDGFAIRVAYALRAWTGRHGVEAIGNLCRTPDGRHWGTVLLTIDAHVASPVTNACPAGMRSAGVDIHSHPPRQHYRANAVDRLFIARLCSGIDEMTTRPDSFSPADYGHPGYMVGTMRLHYQAGLGTSRVVWNLSAPMPGDLHDEGNRLAVAVVGVPAVIPAALSPRR